MSNSSTVKAGLETARPPGGMSVTLWDRVGAEAYGKTEYGDVGMFVLRARGSQDLLGGPAFTVHSVEQIVFVLQGDVLFYAAGPGRWNTIEVH